MLLPRTGGQRYLCVGHVAKGAAVGGCRRSSINRCLFGLHQHIREHQPLLLQTINIVRSKQGHDSMVSRVNME